MIVTDQDIIEALGKIFKGGEGSGNFGRDLRQVREIYNTDYVGGELSPEYITSVHNIKSLSQ